MIIAAGILALPAYRYAKAVRAERLLEESREFTRQQNKAKAYEKALSAHFLNPTDEEILLALANAAIDHRHASALEWWPRVIGSKLRTAEDLKKYVDFLLRTRNSEEAAKYISLLAEELPDDVEVGLMQLRILKEQRKLQEAVNLARNWIDRGYDSEELYRSYIEGLMGLPYEGFRDEARRFLESLIGREDATGRMALRFLVRFPNVDEEQRRDYLARLQRHPIAENIDRLALYQYEIATREVDFATIRDEVLGLFDREDPEQRGELAGWLANMGYANEVLQLIDAESARKDGQLFLLFMNAKIATGAALEVYETTLMPPDQLPVERADNLLLRARALEALGRTSEYRETLDNIARTIDLKEFEKVETVLLRSGHWDTLETLYRRLLQNDFTAPLGKRKLLAAHYYLGDEEALLALLGSLKIDEFDDNPPIQNFVAYLNILHNRDTATSRAAVESLVAKYPRSIDFRLTLALILFLEGKVDSAHELLINMPELDRSAPRYFLVIAATVLSAHGDEEKARAIFQQIELSNMIPRERRLLINAQRGMGTGATGPAE